MPHLKVKLLALTLAVTLALGLAACGGGSDLLPGTTASEINSNLEEVKELVAQNNCAGAEEAVAEVRAQVEGLKGVDARLVEALGEGTAQLEAVVSGCEEPGLEEEETEPLEELEEEPEEKPDKHEQEESEKEEAGEREPAEKEPPEKETTSPEPAGQEKQEEETQSPPEEKTPPSGGVGPGAAVGEG